MAASNERVSVRGGGMGDAHGDRSMAAHAGLPAAPWPATTFVCPKRPRPWRGLRCAILLATTLLPIAGSGTAFAQSPLDKLFLSPNASAADPENPTAKAAARPGSLSLSQRRPAESTPRWTISAEAIG